MAGRHRWEPERHAYTTGRNGGSTYFTGTFNSSVVFFDGENIWTVGAVSSVVVKMRQSDAAIIGSYSIDSGGSFGLTSDGANIWVTNYTKDTITKLRASDGVVLGTFPAGDYPVGIIFDGAHIWVASYLDHTLREFNLDGTPALVVNLRFAPLELAFDGNSIWVAAEGAVIERRGKIIQVSLDGRVLRTVQSGNEPTDIVFDGNNIWSTNYLGASVTKVTYPH